MGGARGRAIDETTKMRSIKLIDETVRAGARQIKACEILGITERTLQRWKKKPIKTDMRNGPNKKAKHTLTEEEKDLVFAVVNSKRFKDMSPSQIVPILLDEGKYIASESTIYRLLRAEKMLVHRQKSQPSVHTKPEELCTAKPNEVWSWDITYLRSTISGMFFYLYMIVDIFSRMIIGWEVHEKESADYSSLMISKACKDQGVNRDELVLHSDNGGPMKGATMLATLQKLGVVPSFSRPRVSDDNPFSESLFKTLKYRPEYPSKPFESIQAARNWVNKFVNWYNTEHYHSGINFVTPISKHRGDDLEILLKRKEVLEKAKVKNPVRWSGSVRNCNPVKNVTLNPIKKMKKIDKKCA